jgi:hypothetical protein
VALAAGVAVMVALLAIILLLNHSGRDVVSTPKDIPDWLTTEPPSQDHSKRGVATAPVDWEKEATKILGPPPQVARKSGESIDWEKELGDVRGPPPPDGSGIFQKYEKMSGQELASREKREHWMEKAELVPESEEHEPHSWLRQRSARQWCLKNPDKLSNTITAFRVQFPNESWTEERELEYRNFLAVGAFDQIAIVALRGRRDVVSAQPSVLGPDWEMISPPTRTAQRSDPAIDWEKELADVPVVSPRPVAQPKGPSNTPTTDWTDSWGDLRVGAGVVIASRCDIENGEVELLEFSGEPLENDGLIHISTLTHLWSLGLHSAEVTDEGIDHLMGLKHLVVLDLNGCSITPNGLAKLANFGELTCVSLDGAQASEAGLRQLKLLPRLERLTLEGPQVSDTTLDLLGAFPKLKYLYLGKTGVTVSGLEKLKRAKPGLKILDRDTYHDL